MLGRVNRYPFYDLSQVDRNVLLTRSSPRK
jgi:hypothetical protein